MRFVHLADVHFGRPFTTLENKGLAMQRRMEQREAFNKTIEYIKENKIEYLFICGDLYEKEYIGQSTIEYINKKFEEIPYTKIYIVPGNHDPNLKNSYYRNYQFSKNVKIFTSTLEKISDRNINIYGYGFEDFYMQTKALEDFKIEENNKINILLTHCDIDGAKNNDIRYNPINKTTLESIGFDYVALGHIHKAEIDEKIAYSGSLISLGFDEQGKHGFIAGEINDETKELKLEFIEADEKEFIEKEFDISDINSKEELIEKINQINFPENKYIKIILIGNRKFEIDSLLILRYISNQNIIKIKDQTKLEIDFENLKNKQSLKGIFIKKLLEKLEQEPENKERIEKAIEIGLNSF